MDVAATGAEAQLLSAPPTTIAPSRPAAGRELLAIAATAIGLRITVFLVVCLGFGVSLAQYTKKGDGESYLARARALRGEPAAVVTEYDTRVFPGYPALIAAASLTGLPVPWAALVVEWLAVGAAAAGAAALFHDRRVGWACAMLFPQYAINSSLAMSESPMLALAVGGLLLARRGRPGWAGLLLGFAGLVRPMACFAVAGAIAADLFARRYRGALATAAVSAAVVLAGVALIHWATGDAFRGVRVYATSPGAYQGQMFVRPFRSLLETPVLERLPAYRILYIYAHVYLVFGGCAWLLGGWFRDGARTDPRDVLALPWLAGNLAFVLCIGSFWGFQHFPRFTVPALPALFWSVRGLLPDRWYLWLTIAVVVFPCVVAGAWQAS